VQNLTATSLPFCPVMSFFGESLPGSFQLGCKRDLGRLSEMVSWHKDPDRTAAMVYVLWLASEFWIAHVLLTQST